MDQCSIVTHNGSVQIIMVIIMAILMVRKVEERISNSKALSP